MRPLETRDMTPADVEFAVKLERAAFGKTLGETTLLDDVGDRHKAFYCIARSGDERLGFAGIRFHGETAEVMTCVVVAAARRKGVGRALMKAMIDACEERGIKSLTLEVRPSNDGALAFYGAYGFSTVGLRKRYYKDGEDAVLMLRPIGGGR